MLHDVANPSYCTGNRNAYRTLAMVLSGENVESLFRKISLTSTLFVCSIICHASSKILCPAIDVVPFPAGNDSSLWQLSRGGYQSLGQTAGRKDGKTETNHLGT